MGFFGLKNSFSPNINQRYSGKNKGVILDLEYSAGKIALFFFWGGGHLGDLGERYETIAHHSLPIVSERYIAD